MRLLEGEWIHDPEAEVLIGPRSGTRIGMGDRVSVRLFEVDVDRARLAFRLDSKSLEKGEKNGG
jgi:exoribonuclease R